MLFVVVVLRQRLRKKIWAQACHGDPSVEKCFVTGAPSFSLKPSRFLENSVDLEVKSNQGGLFPVPTIDLCQQSAIASSLWTFWARLATNCCWGFKTPENCIITTSMNLQLHCVWLSVRFDLPGEPKRSSLFNKQGKNFSSLLTHPLNHYRKNYLCRSSEKLFNLFLKTSHDAPQLLQPAYSSASLSLQGFLEVWPQSFLPKFVCPPPCIICGCAQ